MKKIISFDISSGDKGATEAYKAAVDFAIDFPDWKLKVFSTETIKLEGKPKNIDIIQCKEIIKQDDGALEVRRKKDSTLVRAINSVAENESSGIVSAASSGPLVTAGYLTFKPMKGLKPAFTSIISSVVGDLRIVLDVGANMGANAEVLNQYAVMGSIFAKVIGISDNPIVKQLNIGSESKKGTDLQQEAYKLMESNEKINFKGNIEPNKILSKEVVDVIVTEAYSGNIALKSYEGALNQFKDILKESAKESILDKIGFALAINFRNKLKISVNQKAAGAAVLGLNKLLIKAHGSSNSELFYSSLVTAKTMIEKDLINLIKEELNG